MHTDQAGSGRLAGLVRDGFASLPRGLLILKKAIHVRFPAGSKVGVLQVKPEVTRNIELFIFHWFFHSVASKPLQNKAKMHSIRRDARLVQILEFP